MDRETITAERPLTADEIFTGAEPGPLAPVTRPRVITPEDPKTIGLDRVIVRHTPEIGELFAALAKAQGAFEDLERTRSARIASQKANYTFDYETLADVIAATRKALSENGLSVMQFPFPGRSGLTLRTIVGHASGQWIYNDLSASLDGNDPRSVGSGITYLCRYARKAILGIAAEYDDDAEHASSKDRPQPAQRASQQMSVEPKAEKTPPVKAVDSAPQRGTVVAVKQVGDGWFVKISTGFYAGTRDREVASHVERLVGTEQVVDLVYTPAASEKHAPVLREIQLVAGQTAPR